MSIVSRTSLPGAGSAVAVGSSPPAVRVSSPRDPRSTPSHSDSTPPCPARSLGQYFRSGSFSFGSVLICSGPTDDSRPSTWQADSPNG